MPLLHAPDSILVIPNELHIYLMQVIPDARTLLSLVQTCKHFRNIYLANAHSILKSVAKSTLPSQPGLVEDTLQAACSEGCLTCDDHGKNWKVSNPSKDVWHQKSYTGDKVMCLYRLADLTSGVEDLAEWMRNQERRDIPMPGDDRMRVREPLWRLQKYSQRVKNLDLCDETPSSSSDMAEVPDLPTARAKLLLIEALYFNDGLANPIWTFRAPTKLIERVRRNLSVGMAILHRHQLHPRSQSLIFGIAYADCIALGRLRRWSKGLTDKEIVERLKTDLTAWRSVSEYAGRIARRRAKEYPTTAEDASYLLHHQDRTDQLPKTDIGGSEHDQELADELKKADDREVLEAYLQRFRPLMGLPYGVRHLRLNEMVGMNARSRSLVDLETYDTSNLLHRHLRDQMERNRDAERGRIAWYERVSAQRRHVYHERKRKRTAEDIDDSREI